MGPPNNQSAMDTPDISPGASSDTMDDFNVADTLGAADESIGQVDATDQNELEWNAGELPGDRTDNEE